MKNWIFGKTEENERKHRDIKLVTNKAKNNYLASEANYYTTTFFSEKFLAVEMKKFADIHK